MEYSILKFTQEESIGTLTISRPAALNALNTRFFIEFNYFLDSIEKTKELKVLIITGDGKAFVAGADIAEMQHMNQQEGEAFSLVGQRTFERLEKSDIVVIAAVNGFALGGGCELAMACDFRISSSKAKFGLPEVSLGLIPGYGGTQRLSRLAGLGNALYLVLSGQMIEAPEALRIGLIQKVTEPENLLAETKEFAAKICSQGPNAVKAAKKAIRQGFDSQGTEGFSIETLWFKQMFGGDSVEGMKAFLEKRKAEWK